MKKLLGILIYVFALVALCVVSASAKIIEGDCGDYSTYSFNTETGEMVISGRGDMWGFGMEERPWYEYIQDIKKLTLEEGITSVEGFNYCRNLTEVSLPSTLLSIGP